ncbi:ankyrin repeat-containing domain protein [Phycomyces blakesleeanus]|uniref:Ankyrin repeat-containing domain protein n=1 Tax=Phycomyces blakesleeanus TaxID=4837 RepID=A0ABR3B1D0_PHYBL
MPSVSIFKAIKDNNIDLVKFLIGLGTKSNQSANVTKEDQQWLRNHLKTTGQKQYNLNKRSSKARTALHYAVQWNRISIAQCLIECPMVNINLQDLESGWTALHRALYLGRIEIALLLVQREGCDLSIKVDLAKIGKD